MPFMSLILKTIALSDTNLDSRKFQFKSFGIKSNQDILEFKPKLIRFQWLKPNKTKNKKSEIQTQINKVSQKINNKQKQPQGSS